jgi:membrane protein DedA with SNARE-associated domain
MAVLASIIPLSSSLGYLLPAIIGLESMGIPSPGETALVLAAVLASQGKLNIWLVILIGIVSAIVGDNIGYVIGRKLGREVLEAPGPFQKRRVSVIETGDKFFKKHGPKAVFIARWIALIRFAAAWLAGINHMRFRTFFVYNALGAITWAFTFGLVGYFGGEAAGHVLSQVGIAGAILLALSIVGGLIWLRVRERRAEREMEAETERELAARAEADREAQATGEGDPRTGSEPDARTDGEADARTGGEPDSEPEESPPSSSAPARGRVPPS